MDGCDPADRDGIQRFQKGKVDSRRRPGTGTIDGLKLCHDAVDAGVDVYPGSRQHCNGDAIGKRSRQNACQTRDIDEHHRVDQADPNRGPETAHGADTLAGEAIKAVRPDADAGADLDRRRLDPIDDRRRRYREQSRGADAQGLGPTCVNVRCGRKPARPERPRHEPAPPSALSPGSSWPRSRRSIPGLEAARQRPGRAGQAGSRRNAATQTDRSSGTFCWEGQAKECPESGFDGNRRTIDAAFVRGCGCRQGCV